MAPRHVDGVASQAQRFIQVTLMTEGGRPRFAGLAQSERADTI
jgi:hypothetical protein